MRTECCARRWPLVVVATCSVALVACEDAAAPSVTSEIPPSGVVSFYIAPGDTSWDHYSADVDVTLEDEPPEFNYTGPPTYRHFRYHGERTLGANNVWSSVVTFDPYVPHGVPVPPNVPPGVMRLEDDDLGTYRRLYDRTGALISAPTGVAVEAGMTPADSLPRDWGPPPAGGSFSSNGSAGELVPRLSVGGSGGPREPTRAEAQGWLDQVILTPGRRAHRMQRLARQLGDSAGRVRGLRRYVKRRGSFMSESLVDESLGAILEQNLVRDGQLLQRTLYGYTAVGDGRFVRTHTRIERLRPGHPDRPAVIEHVLSNVRVERRGTR